MKKIMAFLRFLVFSAGEKKNCGDKKRVIICGDGKALKYMTWFHVNISGNWTELEITASETQKYETSNS